jgi:hypothetical protein
MSTGELASSSQKTPAQRLRTKFWHLTGQRHTLIGSGEMNGGVMVSGGGSLGLSSRPRANHSSGLTLIRALRNPLTLGEGKTHGSYCGEKAHYSPLHDDTHNNHPSPNGPCS